MVRLNPIVSASAKRGFALEHKPDNRHTPGTIQPDQPADTLLVGLLWFAFLGIGLLPGTGVSHSQPVPVLHDHAGLVVQFGDSSIITDCVRLREQNGATWSTAEELLNDSALEVDIWSADDPGHNPGDGTSVCRIAQEGCDASDCGCQCTASSCKRWHYRELENEEWVDSLRYDLARITIESGDVVGWVWSDDITAPINEVIPFEQLCMETTPTSTATPTPTDTATSTPTATATETESATATKAPAATSESEPEAASPAGEQEIDLQQEAPAPHPAHEVSPTNSPTRAPSQTTRPTRVRTPRPTLTIAATVTRVPTDPPPTATAVPTVPPPTNTLVPTATPQPTVPPAPTLEPLPTATDTPILTPTIDQTATMAAILATELAIPPTEPPSPTPDPLFATAPPDQAAQALLEQARAQSRAATAPPTRVAAAGAATNPLPLSGTNTPPSPAAPDRTPAQAISEATGGISKTLFWGVVVIVFMGTLLVMQIKQQRQGDDQHDDPWHDER